MQPRNPNAPNTNQTTLNTHMSIQRGPTKIGATHTSSACAACKYQRKKCSPDCLLAPYFPPSHQTQFFNAHKLFGVSNLLKIIRSLNDPIEKEQAMRTMIFQAEVRAKDPVGGCYGLICELQHKIERHQAELTFVLNQLAICRAQAAAGEHHHEIIMNQNLRVPPQSNVYNHINHQHLLQQFQDDQQQQQQQQQQQYYNLIQDNNQFVHDNDYLALNQLWTMETVGNNHDGGVTMVKPSSSSMDDNKQQQQQQQKQPSFMDPDVR